MRIKAYLVNLPTQGLEIGCDSHPTAATHIAEAVVLVAAISNLLNRYVETGNNYSSASVIASTDKVVLINFAWLKMHRVAARCRCYDQAVRVTVWSSRLDEDSH